MKKYLSALLLCVGGFSGFAQTISTVAGTGTAAYNGDNIAATSATLRVPQGVAVDGSGNIYIADRDNYRIRKVNTSGIITTIAGNGSGGFSGDNGPATSASISQCYDLAVDGSGNIFLADGPNNRIRKIDGSGTITTIAGNGAASSTGDGGAASSATLNAPYGIWVDGSGQIFIVEYTGRRVRKIDVNGNISTVAGTGVMGFNGDNIAATSATLSDPFDVVTDAGGNIYIADRSNYRIRKVNTSGIITTIAGNGGGGYSGDGGAATSATFSNPIGVAVDGGGNIYVADLNNGAVRMINSSGIITTFAGNGTQASTGDGGPAGAAGVYYPVRLAFDNAGDLFIAEYGGNRIRKVTAPCVNPTTPTLSATVNTICRGGSTTLSIATGTLNSATTWSWYSGTCGGTVAGTGTSISVTPGATTTYYARATGGCITPGTCGQITINVNDSINISSQPAATTALCEGNTLNLNVTATNAVSYLWNDGNGPLSNGGNISGATSASLQISNITAAQAGTYYVQITGTSPCAIKNSSNAVVTVNDSVDITIQPAASTTLCFGNTFNLSVAAGNAASYQWYNGNGIINDNSDISGSGSNALQITNVAPAQAGTYYVVITGNTPCAADTSSNAVLTVNDTVSVSTQPVASLAVCDGDTIGLSVTAANAAGYQWYKDNSLLSDGANISGSGTNALQVTGASATDAGTYYVAITGNSPCASLNSGNAVVSIDYPAAITTQPQLQPVCSGAGTTLSVLATGAGLNYQWYDGNGAIGNSTPYSGAGTSTLAISNAANLGGTSYFAVVTGTCGIPDTSITVTLTEDFDNAWTGAVDTAWSNQGNWSCGIVPIVSTNVVIPVTALKMPLVDIPTAICNSVTVDAGASLMFVGLNNRLEVKADITNAGTLNGTGGEIALTGTGNQNIAGATYGRLEVSGGSTKTLTGDATVSSILELNNGHLLLNDFNLALGMPWAQSGGSAASYIITNDSGSVIGQNMGLGGNPDAVTFHIGINGTSYTPVILENLGLADTFTVRVIEHVYEDGYGVNPALVTNPVIDRTWLVSESNAGGSYVNMTPHWNLPQQINLFSQSHVYVAHYTGGEWTNYIDSANAAPAAGMNNGLYTAFQDSIQTFSPFTVASSGQFPLAIVLEKIAAVNLGSANRVQWSNDMENTGDSYELERSADGRSFVRITTIKSDGKNTDYTYRDEMPVTGVNYYRVKLLGLNGTQHYSKVVTATVADRKSFSVNAYPNPAEGMVQVQVTGTLSANAALIVTDVAGRVVTEVKMSGNTAELNMGSYASGVYFIKYSDDTHHEVIKINKR